MALNEPEVVVDGLNFPTSIAFDPSGALIVAESGLPFGGAPAGGRIVRFAGGDGKTVLVDGLAPPVNGILVTDTGMFVSVGGYPSELMHVALDGSKTTIIDGFEGPGNYHLGQAVEGPDGYLYFGVGSMTNSGVVGPDGLSIGWLRRLRHAHDVPGLDITLRGCNFGTVDPTDGSPSQTGAFAPFGEVSVAGEHIKAGPIPTASIMKCRPDGSDLELVAWGVRNAYGLGFLLDGRLLAVDQGADDRGSRPIGDVPDFLYEILEGRWYGWPDFMGAIPVTDPRFDPIRGDQPDFILDRHDELPPAEHPLVCFPTHTAATRFCELPPDLSGIGGHLLIALFGDERPMTAPEGPRVGRSIVRVDPTDWTIHPFLGGIADRPIDVMLSPDQKWLYIVDFGTFEMGPEGAVDAVPGTGKVMRVPIPQ